MVDITRPTPNEPNKNINENSKSKVILPAIDILNQNRLKANAKTISTNPIIT